MIFTTKPTLLLRSIRLDTIVGHMKKRDDEYLAKLQDYYHAHHIIPSHAKIAELIGMSKRSASKFIERMVFAGYLGKAPDGRAVPENNFFARSIVGVVPAGFASPAEELLGDSISIDEYLVDNPSSTVLVKVDGESMIGAGINSGDLLVVKRNANPPVNSIVVAMIDGEFTVKYLRKGEQGMYLEPANDAFPNIYPETDLEIYGEMTGLIRKVH